MKKEVEIEFPDYYDELYAFEVESKGYLAGVFAIFPDGKRYPLVFFDLPRLKQDFEAELENGRMHLAEPNLIILEKVTRQAIERAVVALARENYFQNLKESRNQ